MLSSRPCDRRAGKGHPARGDGAWYPPASGVGRHHAHGNGPTGEGGRLPLVRAEVGQVVGVDWAPHLGARTDATAARTSPNVTRQRCVRSPRAALVTGSRLAPCAPTSILISRVGEGHGRPILTGRPAEALERLGAVREPAYAAAADRFVDASSDVDEVSDAVLATFRDALGKGTR
jgi:hypothetical protein